MQNAACGRLLRKVPRVIPMGIRFDEGSYDDHVIGANARLAFLNSAHRITAFARKAARGASSNHRRQIPGHCGYTGRASPGIPAAGQSGVACGVIA